MDAQRLVEGDGGAERGFDGVRVRQEMRGKAGGIAAIARVVRAVEAAGDAEGGSGCRLLMGEWGRARAKPAILRSAVVTIFLLSAELMQRYLDKFTD